MILTITDSNVAFTGFTTSAANENSPVTDFTFPPQQFGVYFNDCAATHSQNMFNFLPPKDMLAQCIPSSCVCLSITSRCSAEMAKRRIIQTMPHHSPGILVF